MPRLLRSPSGPFTSDESGMTLPLLGVTFFAVIGLAGMAVDVARLQLVQTRLSFALDAAGLAAGSTLNTADVNTEVNKYMAANYPTSYLGSTVPSVSVSISENNRIIDLTASTSLPMTFMGLFGFSNTTITAQSQITRRTYGLELVMALDVTGSMAGTKLASMKTAATSLINILYDGTDPGDKLWVGLVPFSQTVNVGTSHASWLVAGQPASLNWATTSWRGCVDAREGSNGDITDTPPTTQPYPAYYNPSTDNRPAPYNTTTYTNYNRWVLTRDGSGNPLTYYSPLSTSRGPNMNCPTAVTPLTANQATILAGISALTAQGYTHINLGAIWAWNMLSPNWRGLWGGEMDANNLPLNYDEPYMNKAVVLLTDGDNTTYQPEFTAYGYLSDGRLGTTTNTTVAVSNLNAKLSTVCTAMKSNGIYVYTITFGSPSTATRNMMRACASAENYYFHAPSTTELQGVFNAIADSLSNLRVSK